MRSHRNARPVPSRLALALCALLAGAAFPAMAADDPCYVWDPVALTWVPSANSTDQGNEHGDSNTTCESRASAYGQGNNAGELGSSAFGYQNRAFGLVSSAFGNSNRAYGIASSAFGYLILAAGRLKFCSSCSAARCCCYSIWL